MKPSGSGRCVRNFHSGHALGPSECNRRPIRPNGENRRRNNLFSASGWEVVDGRGVWWGVEGGRTA